MEDVKMLKKFLLERGAKIGEDVFFGPSVYVDSGFERFLEIEDGAVISQGVNFILHDSSLNNILGLPIKIGKIKICKSAYIGVNTTILCGVEIGENSLIGAGSLVTKNIFPNTVAYGVPAKKICSLSEFKDRYIRKMKTDSNFFYWDVIPWRNRYEKMTPLEEENLFFEFMYSIKDQFFDDAPYCLDFEDEKSARYLFGWYGVEKWPPSIRWTGKKSIAYLKVDKTSSNLFIKAITHYKGININISINKKFMKKFSFYKTDWQMLDIELPKMETNIMEVSIVVDKTWIPKEKFNNEDTRELGIAVNKIWIE